MAEIQLIRVKIEVIRAKILLISVEILLSINLISKFDLPLSEKVLESAKFSILRAFGIGRSRESEPLELIEILGGVKAGGSSDEVVVSSVSSLKEKCHY